MKTSLIGLGPALALILTSTPLWAEDFHCPKPGTVIGFADGGSITFTGQTGLVCEGQGLKSGKQTRQFLGLVSAGSDFERNAVTQGFTLKVGSEFEFQSKFDSSHIDGPIVTNTDQMYVQNNVKVVRQERLTTKMGTFDTLVIEWHQQALGRIQGAWLSTIWFAPELGYRIKGTYETRAGYGPNNSFEIAALTLPARSPTIATPAPSMAPAPPTAITTIAPAAGPAPVAKAAPAPTPAPPAASSVADRLNALKDLRDRKLITPEEYAAKRKEILKSL